MPVALEQPPLSFDLPLDCPIKWTATQEKTVRRDYPFADARPESLQQRVVQVYLEYLWLPESLMPLPLLAPSLRRAVSSPSDPTAVHPLHALLDPLLHTVRSCASKYQHDIAALIATGEPVEPEAEESMLWYALNHARSTGEDAGTSGQPRDEEKERKDWLANMEHRETQIQILLYFLKLSLPGTPPPTHSTSKVDSPSKKRRRARDVAEPAGPALEERLESFMDKLAMWQLMDSLEGAVLQRRDDKVGDERDWTQAFCEDIVEPAFSNVLPDLCTLLRSKVFPHSPFSGDSDTDLGSPGRSSSPTALLSDEDNTSSISQSRKHSRRKPSRTTSRSASLRPPHERARSLSATLAEERNLKRTNSIGPSGDSASAGSKSSNRAFSREVSMTRSFRAREPSAPAADAPLKSSAERAEKKAREDEERRRVEAEKKDGMTLVASTPVKPVRVTDVVPVKGDIGEEEGGVLVEATPTKPRKGRGAGR